MVVLHSLLLGLLCTPGVPQDTPRVLPAEADFYEIVSLREPEGVVLEVSGLAMLPDGRPLVCTRRGEIWILNNAYNGSDDELDCTLFIDGLQEPLGLLVRDGWVYCTQRGELSRLRDVDGDDRADELETVCDSWRISGNYHEYNFGPRLGPGGDFWITTNKPFGDAPFGDVKWRGFALRITPDGEMIPVSAGLRSPAGIEASPWGDMFYTDNQGEWCGASKLSHLEPGDFHGHPWGIESCDLPQWKHRIPKSPPDGQPMYEVAKTHPSFKLPAVWFPYDKMGQSPAGMIWDTTAGEFGPFDGQLFVTDQHHSSLMRVTLEKIEGHWQGACYPFREGFQCGTLRVAWGADGSMFVGETNRGWGSVGSRTEGFERLRWTGAVPFEVLEMNATPRGFRLSFTKPVDVEIAEDARSYILSSYTYLLHSPYGSPEVEMLELEIQSAHVSADRLAVELVVPNLREGFVHELHASGVRSGSGLPLLHDEAYYTLIHVPKE